MGMLPEPGLCLQLLHSSLPAVPRSGNHVALLYSYVGGQGPPPTPPPGHWVISSGSVVHAQDDSPLAK